MTRTALVMDARMVGPRPHGIARYVLGLAAALKDVAPDWRPTLLLSQDAPAAVRDTFTHVVAPHPFLDPREVVGLPAVVAQLQPRLYHATSFSTSPLFTVPLVMTLHDAIHLQRPGDYGLKQQAYYRLVVTPAARRARALITVSQDARAALSQHLGIALERLEVIHNGVDPQYLALPEVARTGAMLTVTGPKPHKNLAVLLHALSHAPGLTLDVVGTPVDGSAALAQSLGLGQRVRFLGAMEEAPLLALVQTARLVVVPSTLEGFGLPVLEGMATGAPVVASDIPVFREVAQDAARYVPPLDSVAWARALTELWNDDPTRAQLSSAGRARAATMTWQRTALATAAVYQRAVESGS